MNIPAERRGIDAIAIGTFVKRCLRLKVRKPHRGARVIEATWEEIQRALTKSGFPADEVS